jgi:phenylalanine-4-hydroxylase
MLLQDYSAYTADDQAVWSILYKRQQRAIEHVAYPQFSMSLKQLGMSEYSIPEFSILNKRLKKLTCWTIYAVPGLISNDQFFKLMLFRCFGATTWIRKKSPLDYLEEPDMFHDIFGHVPLLADPRIAEYLLGLASIADKYIDREEIIEQIARLYWYTIEFGLVKENDAVKIYGAGILSSIGETSYSISTEAKHVPFDLRTIIETPYIKDNYQAQYFLLENMDQLAIAVTELRTILQN